MKLSHRALAKPSAPGRLHALWAKPGGSHFATDQDFTTSLNQHGCHPMRLTFSADGTKVHKIIIARARVVQMIMSDYGILYAAFSQSVH